MTTTSQLVIVANRLPVDRVELPDGSTGWKRSPGGLVSALDPVMRSNDGVWIGWSGSTETDLEPFEDDGLSLVPVPLTTEEIEGFYEGMSNATLWPIYHDVVAKPEFHREWWDTYVDVNRRFTEKAAEVARCLAEGLRESPLVPHAQTLRLMAQLDDVRRQVGVRYPADG